MGNFYKQAIAFILLVSFLLEGCYNSHHIDIVKKESIPQHASNKGGCIPLTDQQQEAEQLTNISLSTLYIEQTSDPACLVTVENTTPSPKQSTLVNNNKYTVSKLGKLANRQDANYTRVGLVAPIHPAIPTYANRDNKLACLQAKKRLVENQQKLQHYLQLRSSTSINNEAANELLLTKEGHQVRLKQLLNGNWQAVVDESLPIGISRKIYLPVYIALDFSIIELYKHSPEWQKKHIHVICQKEKSYVWVGSKGLPGGMKKSFSQQEPSRQKEASKEGKKEEVLTQKISPVPSNPAHKSFPTVFRSASNLTYHIFPHLTLETAKHVQEQTGLFIPFEPGKDITEYIGGRGAFGELRVGKEENSGKYFGVKIIRLNTQNFEELEEARAEALLQRRLNGLPHLMPLIDSGEAKDEYNNPILYQVMPLAGLGNGAQLADYLQNIKDPSFKEGLLLHVAKSILQAFVAMHSLQPPIAHLDFKPHNLVIDDQGELYIIDFGCSKFLTANGQLQEEGSGDIGYFSPERYASMLEPSKRFRAKAADSWAIGLTLLELTRGIIANKAVINQTNPSKYLSDPVLENAAPGTYAAMVKGFLNLNEAKRLTPGEALSLDIFKKETSRDALGFLKEFIQTMQWNKRAKTKDKQGRGISSAQQLPLPHFIGYARRPELEQAVINKLIDDHVSLLACVGMGGVGKSQLLTYLVHSNALQKGFEHIYWFHGADNEASLLAQYHGLAREVKLVGEKATEQEAKVALLQWLEKNGDSSLLVFDNADDPAVLDSFLPKGKCQVLVSSRSPRWKDKIEVNVFILDHVEQLLTKLLSDRIKTSKEDAKLLGETMGYLPLAINQAIALIRQEQSSIADYVKNYQTKQQELLKTNTQLFGRDLPYSMVALYQVQLAKLEKECPEAVRLLEYAAMLAPDKIPLSLLKKGLFKEELSDELYKKAQRLLVGYALWQVDEGTESVRMHRLVQEVVKLPLGANKLREIFLDIAARICKEYNRKTSVLADEIREQGLIAHMEVLKKLAENQEEVKNHIEFGNLLGCIAHYSLYQQGAYAKACTLLEQALKIIINCYGKDHSEAGITLANLGNAYGALGNHEKKKELLEQALKIIINCCGEDHPEVGITLANLGNAYGALGNHEKKKELLEQAIKIMINCYGEDHPEVGIALANLGNAYGILGNHEKKKELLEQAIKIMINCYGEDHPEIGITLANLGNAYGALGNHEKKKELLEQALKINIKHYGENVPITGLIIANRTIPDISTPY